MSVKGSRSRVINHCRFRSNWELIFNPEAKKIPKGLYCYDENGLCPHWSCHPEHGEQNNGYCAFMKYGDWEDDHFSLLWDQCKECGINLDERNDL